MGEKFTKIQSGLNLKTTANSPAPSIQGDIQVDLASANLVYHNGTVANKIATETNTLTLTNKTLDATLNTLSNIANVSIAAAAAIAYSKLNLTGSIVNADVSATAGIQYSKLNLAGSVQLSDHANLAANSLIGNLTGSPATPAAVPVTSTNTPSTVVQRDGSGNFSAGTITANLTGNVTGTVTGHSTLDLALTGGTMSGAIDMGNHQINNLSSPTAGTDVANKNYVDNAMSGIQFRPEADLRDSVDTALPTGTSATIDGVVVTNGMRVLFTNLAANNNEVYVVSGVGTALAWTAALDNDRATATPVKGDSILVLQGTNNATSTWSYNGTAFVQTNGATQIQAGVGLTKSGNTLGLASVPAHSILANSTNSTASLVSTSFGSGLSALSAMQRDANNNTQVNNLIESGLAIATSGGSTSIGVGSPYFIQFTGSQTHTLQLPDATTLTQYQQYYVANRSTGTIAVKNDSGTSIGTIQGGTQAIFTCTDNSTIAGVWDISASSSGSGSGGTKNYLTTYNNNSGNGNFEQGSTTGWSLFNTTLTSGIPTGSVTAGAASITTFAATGTAQLAGNFSLQTSSSAAWSAGQGFISDAFTIDNEDTAKMMTIGFYYKVTAGASNLNFSGTSSNTFAVYVYAVDGTSGWIQPAGVYNLVQNSGAGKCTATFQTTSNSTQYRIAVLAVNASAGAATVLWDDFTVGPQTAPMGPAMTDPQSTTLTFNNLGTTTSQSAFVERHGKWAHFWGNVTCGTTPAAAPNIQLPAGYVLDTANLPPNHQKIGSYAVNGNANSSIYGSGNAADLFFDGLTNNQVFFGETQASANTAVYIKANASSLITNNALMTFDFWVPIAGWSSNTAMSSDTDTRVVAFEAQPSLPTGGPGTNNTEATLIYGTPINDTHGAYNSSTGIYTIPISGWYTVAAGINYSGSFANNGEIQLYVIVNGVGKAGNITYDTSSTGNMTGSVSSGAMLLKAGDQVRIDAYLSNWTSFTLASNSTFNFFRVHRLSGPAVVAATESVNFSYSGTPTGSPSSTQTQMTITSKDFDSHNAVSSGVFTAPVSGKYRFSAGAAFSSGGSSNNTAVNTIQFFKNGTAIGPLATDTLDATETVNVQKTIQVTKLLQLSAGDQIIVKAQTQFTTPTWGSNGSWFDGERVGN